MPNGKHNSHWKVVLERRQNQRVSRISAAAERNIPVKMVADIRAIVRLWRAGMGPRGTGRRQRTRERRRRRERDRMR